MKNKPLFYKIYFSCLAVFGVLIIIGLIAFNGWLASYENAQPENIVNNIVETYVKANNVFGLKAQHKLDVSAYETADTVNSAVAAAINGKTVTSSTLAARPEGCDLAYTIKADEQKLLNVYLKKNEGSALTSTYEILKISLADEFYKPIKIMLPTGAKAFVNGIAVSDADIKTSELPKIPNNYAAGNLSAPQYADIYNLVSENPTVTAFAGEQELNVTKSGSQYLVAQDISNSEKISNFAIEASKTYSAYMQNDGSLNKIKKYFSNDTEFYENLRTSLVIFSLDHEGFRFDDAASHEILKYSDSIYSCRVTLTQVLIRNGAEYKDYYNKNVYIYVDGQNMKVIDLQSSGAK